MHFDVKLFVWMDTKTDQLGLKGCYHGAIAIAFYKPQLIGCMGFSVTVGIAPYKHLHWYTTEAVCYDEKITVTIAPCEQSLTSSG